MSTPQTLTQALPPHHHLDHRQRYLPSPQDRYLPPPRPSSNLSNSFHQNIPARPSSNISNHHFAPPPPRSESGMSGPAYTHSHAHRHSQSQASGGAEQSFTENLVHKSSHEELRRTNSTASQRRALPPPPQPPSDLHTSMPSKQAQSTPRDDEMHRGTKRGRKSPVDWVDYFGGKPPAEIITIHDDNSPPPPASVQKLPPPTTNGGSTAQHVGKKRRTDAGDGDARYSTTNTSHSLSNGASTESLNTTTTAATSLGSQASSSGKLDSTQVGQKRKRTTKAAEPEPKKQATESRGPRGYLAEYGEYVPPPKQHKKQKEVTVPTIHDVGVTQTKPPKTTNPTSVQRQKTAEKIDDDDGHYVIQENSRIGERYTLVQQLGQGTFGKVVKALDIRTRREVAVKIIRAVPKYRDASRIELRVLQTLRAADEHNKNRCIQLRDCFDWRGHICIVTPLLGLSVFDFLKQGGFVPFPGSHIQAFACQLLHSIAFLHDLDLIHTDLKPENILLISHLYQTFTYNRNIPASSTLTARSAKFRKVLLSPQINLIDFGSATFDDEYHSSVVSTRHYRAPEIILGIGWSHPIDLWSLGCILVECWTGDALFQTHDCCEHLAMMEAVTGNPIDKSLIREVTKISRKSDRNSAARFFKNGHLAYPLPDTPRQSRKFVRGMKRLEEIIPPTNLFNRQFLDLLRKIFVYDPKKRITAREALKHPWFDELVEDDGTEAGRIRVERERLAEEQEARRR